MSNLTIIRRNSYTGGGFCYLHPLCLSRTSKPGLTAKVLQEARVDMGGYELVAVEATEQNWPCPLCHKGVLNHPGEIHV